MLDTSDNIVDVSTIPGAHGTATDGGTGAREAVEMRTTTLAHGTQHTMAVVFEIRDEPIAGPKQVALEQGRARTYRATSNGRGNANTFIGRRHD